MAREQLLNTTDDIAWLISTHCPTAADRGYRSAIVRGNEDAPDRVSFYRMVRPHYKAKPIAVFTRQGNELTEEAPTRVILRRWRDSPRTVIALMPDDGSNGECPIYEKVGQNPCANYRSDYDVVIGRTDPVRVCSERDAADLVCELESIGYVVQLSKRQPPQLNRWRATIEQAGQTVTRIVRARGEAWALRHARAGLPDNARVVSVERV